MIVTNEIRKFVGLKVRRFEDLKFGKLVLSSFPLINKQSIIDCNFRTRTKLKAYLLASKPFQDLRLIRSARSGGEESVRRFKMDIWSGQISAELSKAVLIKIQAGRRACFAIGNYSR